VYLYSALFVVPHTQGAQAWITRHTVMQLHQCLPLPRDVNKAGSLKAKAKAKAKSLKAKTKSLKAKAKARSLKAKTKAKAKDQG